MITIESQGDWKLTRNWFDKMTKLDLALIMNQFGKEGVSALKSATPSRSGETAASWNYEVTRTGNSWKITWTNSHVNNGVNIAVILQSGPYSTR